MSAPAPSNMFYLFVSRTLWLSTGKTYFSLKPGAEEPTPFLNLFSLCSKYLHRRSMDSTFMKVPG